MSSYSGHTILITGATDGIGLALARKLMVDNDLVIIGRSEEKLNRFFGSSSRVRSYVADMSSLKEVASVSLEILTEHPKLDLLIHNASCVSSNRVETDERNELQLAVNYLAPVLLTQKLLAAVTASKGDVLFINSRAHKRAKFDFSDPQLNTGYDLSKAYNRSKLYLMMFAKELSVKLEGKGVSANSIHPGLVNTKMGQKNCSWHHRLAWIVLKQLGKSPDIAARNIIKLLQSRDYVNSNGKFFGPKQRESPSSWMLDADKRKELWEITEKIINTSILSLPKTNR